MEPEFWHQRWQNGQIGFHLDEVNPVLARHFAPRFEHLRGSRVFVPLSGKSLDQLWLVEAGFDVVSVEVSPLAVKAFFEENGLSPTQSREPSFERCSVPQLDVICGDFFELTADDIGDIAVVYDRASLIALPPEMRIDYARQLRSLTQSPVLLVTLFYPQEQMSGPPFAVSEDEVRQLYEQHYVVDLLQRRDVLEAEPRFRDKGVTAMEECVYLLTPR